MSAEVNALATQLATLSSSLKETLQFIQQLARLQPAVPDGSSLDITNDDETRADLSASIHERLKSAEDELEILRHDVVDLENAQTHASGRSSRRSISVGKQNETQRELARCLSGCDKAAAEIKLTRQRFRRAQLTAQSHAERASQRERAAYLASLQAVAATQAAALETSHTEASTEDQQQPPPRFTDLFAGRRKGHPGSSGTSTQDDILLTTTSDVTSSLRRTHNLLQSEISRSQFAHETLASSNAALEELNSRYNTFDDLLSKSRGLLGTLLRSQKSDTWYLETAIAILVGTIGWLIFRRFLYGPAWWLIWMPLKLIYNILWGIGWTLGVTGGSKAAQVSISGHTTVLPSDTISASRSLSATVRPTSHRRESDQPTPAHSLSESIASMMDANSLATPSAPTATDGNQDNSEQQEQSSPNREQQPEPARRGDGQTLPERDEATQPRNPKKRQMEEPPSEPQELDEPKKKDEL